MNKVVGIGIALVGGYFLLKAMGVDVLAGGTPSVSGQVATGATTSTSPQASTPASQATNQLIQAIYNKVIASKIDPMAYYTVDVWNTFYVAVKNTPGPAPEDLFPNVDRNTTYNFQQYAGGLTAHGLAGLGTIAHYVNPYTNVQGTPMGSNLVPTGFEKFIVVRGA
jgi:hypothetical protein